MFRVAAERYSPRSEVEGCIQGALPGIAMPVFALDRPMDVVFEVWPAI